MIFVVIPVYNCEKYIENTVKSVLDQPYKNIEVILVNDGSTDSSGALCDKMACKNERVTVIHSENGGVSKARNAGIECAISRMDDDSYLTFLDADDLWFPNVVNSELINKFNDADIVGMGIYLSNESVTRFVSAHSYEEHRLEFPQGGNLKWFWGGFFTPHLFKIKMLKDYNLKFMPGVKVNEDVIFIREAFFCARSVEFLSVPLYIYRRHETSVSHSNFTKKLDNALDIANAFYKAKDWSATIQDVPEDRRIAWTKDCEALVGARLLESARSLAEAGYGVKEIKKTILDSELSEYLNKLDEKCLAEWQKPDLQLIREILPKFVRHYKINGFVKRSLQRLIRIKFFKNIREKHTYPLEKLD